MSDWTMPRPTLYLRFYSLLLMYTPTKLKPREPKTYAMKIDQSSCPHLSIPMIEGDLFDPLIRLTSKEIEIMKIARTCFLHCRV